MEKSRRDRVSVVVVHNNQILGFHAEDPHNRKKYFFLPGGLIEPGESPAEAALRETLEETGYTIKLIEGISAERRYDFEWNGRMNDCVTLFLAGRLLNEEAEKVDDAPYHRGVEWVPIERVRTVFSYHKDILEPIEEIINRLGVKPT